ncbi:glycosyltransferase [Arcticibacter eurypsychrophilus]|uniref:glycosyltransferase n=1 Tax=Arcticibacter eurypsychrophilus TaxID=1434752 RepID=UPI00084DA82A|nr:glycosyltransferase [Arcticibacter eurypsychrophilus]
MIFVTTGTQAPFNRLILAMDEIAAELGEEVIAQASGVDFPVKNLKIVEFLNPTEYKRIFKESKMVISHAGMGTIISALKDKKPILIVPRVAALGEHRNEHQYATAKKIEELGYMPVVYDMVDLKDKVISLRDDAEHYVLPAMGDLASVSLIQSLQEFISKDKL